MLVVRLSPHGLKVKSRQATNIMLEWQQLQTAWKQEDDGNKNLLLASIRVGTIKAVVAMYQACEFQENLLIFRDIVMESIQMSINANPPSTIIQNAAASFSISCDELMSERIIQCLKEPNRPKEAFNEFKKLLLSANVFYIQRRSSGIDIFVLGSSLMHVLQRNMKLYCIVHCLS